MIEVKFLSQSFSVNGFVVLFAKGDVDGSQTWCRVLAFAKETASFYFA